tara:strand:+ start:518 stop:1321 length:804 start_codon:yes stop_codon:yes gene_type:complete
MFANLMHGLASQKLDLIDDESVDFALMRLDKGLFSPAQFKPVLIKIRSKLRSTGFLIFVTDASYWLQVCSELAQSAEHERGDLAWYDIYRARNADRDMAILVGRSAHELVESHRASQDIYTHIQSETDVLSTLESIVQTRTDELQTVLDCSMGTGVSAQACVNTNRNYIGIEQNQDSFDDAFQNIIQSEVKEMIFNGQILREVGGIELINSSENPNFAITLSRGNVLADAARLEAIRVAKSDLETQRFINAVDGANRYPSITQIHIF